MKKTHIIGICVFSLIFCLSFTFGIFCLLTEVKREKSIVQVTNNLDRARAVPLYVTKNIYEKNDMRNIDINIPYTNSKNFNTLIDDIVKKYMIYINEAQELSKNNDSELVLQMRYSVNNYNDNIVSFVIRTDIYLGGAHPNSYIDTITFNFEKDKNITLNELFSNNKNYLNQLSKIARKELSNNEKIKEYYIKEMFYNGTEPKKENFIRFALEKECLILFFERYQIAPYVAGEFNICVDLKNINFNDKI